MKTKRNYVEYAGMLLPLLMALICMFAVWGNRHQALLPIPMPQSFIGEYSYDGENWLPLTDDAELSALDGDLLLRGHFENDTVEGQEMRYFRNHIGVTVYVNGELFFIDTLSEMKDMKHLMFSSMCGQEWGSFYCNGITSRDEVEIRLYNPHRYGNSSAYRDFLSTLCCDVPGSDILEKNLHAYGEPFRMVGSLCVIVSIMLLGAAVTAFILRIPMGGKLFKQGLITLFAGCFIFFDTFDISFTHEVVAFNSYAKYLSMMLAVFFAGCFVCDSLTGKRRITAKGALAVSSVLNAVLIILSIREGVAIYDMVAWWAACQLILCPLMMICCAIELYRHAEGKRLVLLSGIGMFATLIMDIFGVFGSIVWQNPCSKVLFALLLVVYALEAARGIVINQRATIRAAKLEEELEHSRISIMLSQIQPHFLYNVLGTIRGLCRADPMMAWQALGDFSDYLRGNMSALANNKMIHFTGELRHIEAYLRLEKMRMREKLNILYDIQEKNFLIPPLTIQPLVENAVAHGLFEKGGGTLILHTRREGEQIVISVQDDGVGFDPDAPLKPDDRHEHVGLTNVRSRLDKLSGGKLTIDSAPGKGTTITVTIQRENAENGGADLNEHTGSR